MKGCKSNVGKDLGTYIFLKIVHLHKDNFKQKLSLIVLKYTVLLVPFIDDNKVMKWRGFICLFCLAECIPAFLCIFQ